MKNTQYSSKRIAKNTILLYIRMLLVMIATLYTSRIVLAELGESDYGIYTLVAGFVAMLGFFNAAMVSATQRYLAFDIGRNDIEKLRKTFNTTLVLHILIALLFFIIAQTVGLWYVNNKLVFPSDRIEAVNTIYQYSILTFSLTVIQVPYNALIVARERMGIYTYISIVEVIFKLIIAYALIYMVSTNDKLQDYAMLIFLATFIVVFITYAYCRKEFSECRFSFQKDYAYYKELSAYSMWNIFGNLAVVAKLQGVNIVLNIFYGTIVNSAYGIASQVLSAVNMFATNLQAAMNPQIVKNYSNGNIVDSQNLILKGSKFSFLLILLLITPILLNTEYILELWLLKPPQYSIIFVKLTLINVLIDSLSGTLMTGIQATGKIKNYQIIVGILVFLNLPLSYVLLKMHFVPQTVYIVSIIISIISLQLRLIFLKLTMKFNVQNYYKEVVARAILLMILIFGYIHYSDNFFAKTSTFSFFIIETLCSIVVVLLLILIIGLSLSDKEMLKQKFYSKFKQKWLK